MALQDLRMRCAKLYNSRLSEAKEIYKAKFHGRYWRFIARFFSSKEFCRIKKAEPEMALLKILTL